MPSEISEAFDIGIMMAEIDGKENWEEVIDDDFNDYFEDIVEPPPASSVQGVVKNIWTRK